MFIITVFMMGNHNNSLLLTSFFYFCQFFLPLLQTFANLLSVTFYYYIGEYKILTLPFFNVMAFILMVLSDHCFK